MMAETRPRLPQAGRPTGLSARLDPSERPGSGLRARLAAGPTWLPETMRYAVVSASNTAVDFGLYLALTHWVGFFAVQLVLAKAISHSAGILNGFPWNLKWTFQSDTSAWRAFPPYVLSRLGGLALNSALWALGLNVLHLPQWQALALSSSSFAWTFLLSKFVVFRGRKVVA